MQSEKTSRDDPGVTSTGRFRQYVAAASVNLLAFSFGCVVGWPSPVQKLLESGDSSPLGAALSADEISWLGSITFLGGMVGTAAWGQVADRFGRKGAGYAIAAPVLAGWLLIVASLGGLNGFFAGRFLLGLGASGCFVLVPLYVSEIADDGVRGFLGSFLILFVNLGVLVAYVGGACLDYVPFGLLCAGAPLLFVITYFRLPETPIYLASKKRHREAAASLAYFRGHSAAQELPREEDPSKRIRLADLINHRGTFKAFIIGLVLLLCQQFDGILVVLTYTSAIFSAAGSTLTPAASSILVGLFQLAASYASTLLVERSGRRPLLLFSFSVMALSLIILGIYFKFLLGNTTWGLLPVACLCVYVVAYAMGAGPVPYVVMSETFSPQIRATATSIIVLWGTAMAFCTIKVFPHLNEHLGQAGAFWFFAAFCLFGLGFTWTLLPETKGRSLEDILRELNGGQDYKQREEAKETLKEFI